MAAATITRSEHAEFQGMLTTLADLSQAAERRGDRLSAELLLNVVGLLAEVRVAHAPVPQSVTPASVTPREGASFRA